MKVIRRYREVKTLIMCASTLVVTLFVLRPTVAWAQSGTPYVTQEQILSTSFIKVVRQNDGTLFVLGKYNWLLKGSSDAKRWERVNVPSQDDIQAVDMLCDGQSGVLLQYSNNTFYRTFDNGVTWSLLPGRSNPMWAKSTTHLPNHRVLDGYVTDRSGQSRTRGFVISRDFGSRWDTINHPELVIDRLRLHANRVFCAGVNRDYLAFDLDNGKLERIIVDGERIGDAAFIGNGTWVASVRDAILLSRNPAGPWSRFSHRQEWNNGKFEFVDSTRVFVRDHGGAGFLGLSLNDNGIVRVDTYKVALKNGIGLTNIVTLPDSYLYGGEFHTLVEQRTGDSLRLISAMGGTNGMRAPVEAGVPSSMLHQFGSQTIFVSPNGAVTTPTPDGLFWVPLFNTNPFDSVTNSLRGLWLTQRRGDSLVMFFSGHKKVLTGTPLRLTTAAIEVPGENVRYAFINDSIIFRQYFAADERGFRASFLDVSRDYGNSWMGRRKLIEKDLYLNSAARIESAQLFAVFFQRPIRVTNMGFGSFTYDQQAARYELVDWQAGIWRASDIFYDHLQYQKLVEGPRSVFQPVSKVVLGPTEDGSRAGTLLKYESRFRDPEEEVFGEQSVPPFLAFSPGKKEGLVLMNTVSEDFTFKCRVRVCNNFETFLRQDADTISSWSYGVPRFINDSLVAYIADDHVGILSLGRRILSSVAGPHTPLATLKLWPNPASQSVQISVSGSGRADEPGRLVLVDMLGQTVADLSPDLESPTGAASGELQWDFPPGLPSGTYRLVYQSGAHRVSEPLVIQR